MKTKEHDVSRYTFFTAWSDEEEGYIARVTEFPHLATDGKTRQEAIDELKKVIRVAIDMLLEDGNAVPQPLSDKDYQGRITLRLPKSLHRQLAVEASVDSVSLNSFITLLLAGAIERHAAETQRAK